MGVVGRGFERALGGWDPDAVTGAFLLMVLAALVWLVNCLRKGRRATLTDHAPAVLATLGILGTFVGIVVGLLAFDPRDLDGSIENLLDGLKTAFISSIAGMTAGLTFRLLEPIFTPKDAEAQGAEVGPEDVVAVLTEQKELLAATQDAIAGDEESSLAGQFKHLRVDLRDGQQAFEAELWQRLTGLTETLSRSAAEQTELLSATRDAIAGSEESSLAGQLKLLRADLGDRQRAFETELWQRLTAFAEMLSRSATEQVMEALKEVIVDFNQNLTEQFGDNFKRLDESVQKLVEWQDGYRRQLEQLHVLYEESVRKITTIEESVARIAERSESIPASMEKLTDVLKVADAETAELERHLAAFAELRDRAVQAVPEAQAHVQAMTEDIGSAVRLAGEHVTQLQRDSTDQLGKSREMLEELARAGEKVQSEILTVQDSVTHAVELMQSRVETALKEALDTQREETGKLVQGTVEHTREAVTRTGEAITSQLKALDEALAGELERVMQGMANALVQISDRFVTDYSGLVQEMERVDRMRRGNRQRRPAPRATDDDAPF